MWMWNGDFHYPITGMRYEHQCSTYLKQIQSPVGISSSTKGGQWQVKWNEAGQESQQIKSPPSPQASQQSWLWPFPGKK